MRTLTSPGFLLCSTCYHGIKMPDNCLFPPELSWFFPGLLPFLLALRGGGCTNTREHETWFVGRIIYQPNPSNHSSHQRPSTTLKTKRSSLLPAHGVPIIPLKKKITIKGERKSEQPGMICVPRSGFSSTGITEVLSANTSGVHTPLLSMEGWDWDGITIAISSVKC